MPTNIAYADETWNPMSGCTKISPGCQNCFAEAMAKRLAGRHGYPAINPFAVTLHPDKLTEPLGWKKPRKILLASMGDVLHPLISFDYLNKMIDTIYQTPQHTYLLLTKRHDRLFDYITHSAWLTNDPLLNLWLGVTVVNQEEAEQKIPVLFQTPAAKHFISYEPALGPLDLSFYVDADHPDNEGYGVEARLRAVYAAGMLPRAQLYQPEEWIEYSREWKKFGKLWQRPGAYRPMLKAEGI